MSDPRDILTLGAAAPWKFGSPALLLLLIVVPVVGLLLWLAFVRARRALERFEGVTPQSSRPSVVRAGLKVALSMIALSSLVVAIARPQADPVEETVTVRGRDIVFLVDVSKSMLSRDAVPSRLGRAKLWINDLVNTLKGDRVGLVAFAGVPVVKCPLTLDYGYFRMALDELSPASVPRGGTLIGDAIRKTLSDVFEPGPGRYKDIVLITDGEDQGSYADQAAQKAAEMGVRIIAIGIGSELEGSLVPSEEGNSQKYVEHDGQKVHSRLDSSTLAGIAAAASGAAGETGGGGVFLNVGTGTMDLDKVYHDLIGSAERKETETKSNVTYRELFPYFLGLAVMCLAIEPLIGGRAVVRRRTAPRARGGLANPAVAAIAIGALMMPVTARAQTPEPAPSAALPAGQKPAPESTKPVPAQAADALYNSGREKFLAGQYAQAADEFRQADLGATDSELSARARFNLGQALLKQAAAPPAQGEKPDDGSRQIAQLDSAARAFRSVLDVKPGDAEAARNVEIARKLMKDVQEEQQKQQKKDQQKKDQQKKDQQKKDQQKKDQQKKDGDSSGGEGDSDKDQQSQKNEKQDSKQNENDSKQNKSQQSKSQQHQENADKLKDLAQQQSQAADKSNEAQEQKDSASKEGKKQEAGKAQEQVSKETQAEKEKQDKSKDESSKDAKQKLDDARKEQEAASQSLEKGDPKGAEEHQRKAAEMLDQAAEAEQKAADEAAKSEAEGKDKKDEKPKYNDTASQLLDKERKQRDARQQVLRALKGRPQPVDKDW